MIPGGAVGSIQGKSLIKSSNCSGVLLRLTKATALLIPIGGCHYSLPELNGSIIEIEYSRCQGRLAALYRVVSTARGEGIRSLMISQGLYQPRLEVVE
jgi:hypothetical protein